MRQDQDVEHRPPESRLWRPDPVSRRGIDARRPGDGRDGDGQPARRAGRSQTSLSSIPLPTPLTEGPPLTALGVSIVLAGACLLGATLDLLLVSTAAWALTGLFLGACAYAASKVRRSDWYSAVVGPPLA